MPKVKRLGSGGTTPTQRSPQTSSFALPASVFRPLARTSALTGDGPISRPFVTLGSTPNGRAALVIREQPEYLEHVIRRPTSGSLHDGWRLHRSPGVKRKMIFTTDQDPPYLEPLRPHHRCAICHGVKAHPVTTDCGHTYCFYCLRVWLQQSWRCPTCMKILRAAPIRNFDLECWLDEAYPELANDTSRPTYSFSSLVFPTI
uniref:RING-type domain-containing protein n=1 Tax=Mycena chlorophos TaxID=658473 RepID=A0ABQ0M4U1_MYCCL|nr:predicted protein [Mycena chlorophos]